MQHACVACDQCQQPNIISIVTSSCIYYDPNVIVKRICVAVAMVIMKHPQTATAIVTEYAHSDVYLKRESVINVMYVFELFNNTHNV